MKNILIVLFLTLIALFSCVADETDKMKVEENSCPCPVEEKDKDKTPWENSFNLGYNKTQGNSDTSLLNMKIISVYDQDKNNFRLEADHSFGDNDSETNVDTSNALAEYKRILNEKLYSAIGSKYNRNEISDVKYRVTINPALGYFLYKDNPGFFNVEAGPSYLFEEVGDVSDDYLGVRFAERFEYKLSDTAKIFHNAEIIGSTEDSDNYIVQGEVGIETKIIEGFNLIFTLRDVFDNQPAEDKKKNDLMMLTSFGVSF